MNEVTNTPHQAASRHGTGVPVVTRKSRAAGMNDMTRLILAAIASGLLAGLLVLPVTMPGTARLWAQAELPAPLGPTALAKGPVSTLA